MSLFNKHNEEKPAEESHNELIKESLQMTKEEVREKYHELAKRFAEEDFDDVYEECDRLKMEYYACYPFIMQLGVLYCNHFMLAGVQSRQVNMLKEAGQMFETVMKNSKDKELARQAESMTASCYLMLRNTKKVFDILGKQARPLDMSEEIISQAYQTEGNTKKALEVAQAGIYQHLLGVLSMTPNFLMLTGAKPEKTQEIMRRTLLIADVYNMDSLHPNTMLQIYFTAAEVYCLQRNFNKAINMLENYADVCVNHLFPYRLRGDDYFDSIDDWIDNLDLGAGAPRDEKFIKESVVKGIENNPIFKSLANEEDYKNVLKKLDLMK